MNFLQNIGIVPFDDSEKPSKEDGLLENNSSIQKVSRRSFLKNTGIASSSLVIGIQLSPASAFCKDSDKKIFNPDVFI